VRPFIRGSWFEEAFQPIAVVFEIRGQLPEEGAQLFAQAQEAGGEEVCKRSFRVFQASEMGDVAAAFDGEDEIGGSGFRPCLEAGWALEGVEGAVDLDGIDGARGVFKLALLRPSFRVKDAAPGRVGPSRYADARGRHADLLLPGAKL
jgi:hypothetical protein